MSNLLPNGLQNYFNKRSYASDLSQQYDWIFNGEAFEVSHSANGSGQPKLGFGALNDYLKATRTENQREKFYAKLITRLALHNQDKEMKDLFAVLTAHENSRTFAINLAFKIEKEIANISLPYPYQGQKNKVYDAIQRNVLNGPDRNARFIRDFKKALASHLSR